MPSPAEMADMWDFDDAAASEEMFRARAAESRAAGAEAGALEYLTQVARALTLQERFDEADEVLDEIEERITDAMTRVRIRSLLERGRRFNSDRDPGRALPLFEEAWTRALASGDGFLAVDAAHMAAIAAPPDDRILWSHRGLDHAESSDDPEARRWLGSLYNNMGWDAHDRGEHEEALRLLTLAWDWRRAHGPERAERIARWAVAKELRFLGRFERATEIQLELLAEYELHEPGGDGFVHEELAELFAQSGDPTTAAHHAAIAHDRLARVSWLEAERIERLEQLAAPQS